jgi:subtilisin family serine protease
MKFKIALICIILAQVAFVGRSNRYWGNRAYSVERSPSIVDNRAYIAVIDSGLQPDPYFQPYLCLTGHKDFTNTGLNDYIWHGTAIAKLITYGMNPKTQCLLIVKYYDPLGSNLENLLKAFEHVLTFNNVKYLNFSGGGTVYDEKEDILIAKLLNKGIKVIVAGGNEGMNFDKDGCQYFPACTNKNHPNMYPIGNCDKNGIYASSSNYGGPIKHCRDGYRIKIDGKYISGTSVSTAIVTSELIKKDIK